MDVLERRGKRRLSYLKGKDIKQQGDCLVYCYTRRIENISEDWNDQDSEWEQIHKPEGFETIKVNDKW